MRFIIKNKTTTFFAFNIILLIVLVVLSFPLYKFLTFIAENNKVNQLSDNEYVKDSSVITSNSESIEVIDRKMKITFVAEVDDLLNWKFQALQKNLEVKVGENQVVKFEGKNLSHNTITGTADFFALPEEILPYLIKTECFCFTKQILKPGESQIFSMVFFLDPSLDQDSDLDNLKELTLTYKFSEFLG